MGQFKVFEIPANIERELIDYYRDAPHFSLDTLARYKTELRQHFGVYCLYYRGEFELYQDIAAKNMAGPFKPIYVGKAVSAGGRTGKSLAENSLFKRLGEHSRTIKAASTTLQVQDFDFRVIPMKAELVQWAEHTMIRRLRPPWNSHLSGFGIHDPGKGRYNQKRSVWDQIHSGRSWAEKMESLATYDLEKIREQMLESMETNLDTFDE